MDLYDGIRLYSSTAASAGTSISWTEILRAQSDNFLYKGQTVYHSGNNSTILNSNVTLSSLGAQAAGNYLTSYSETDTLDTVCDRGASTDKTLTSTNQTGFKVDSTGYARIVLDATDSWSYVRFADQGVTTWDIASLNSGNLEWRPAGSSTNRMTYSTGGVLSVPTLSVTDYGLASADIPNNAANTSGSSGSCTGNAATATLAANSTLAGGLAIGTGRNNSANQIVRTQANGYIDCGWINTTSGNTTATITDVYINTNDGYIRKATGSVFGGQIGQYISYDDITDKPTIPAAESYTQHESITQATSNVNNSGRTYIQDITLDSNGHVTGVGVATETVTDTTYSKASFDLDHLFTLVGAAADTSTNMGNYTSGSVPQNQTLKQNIDALSTRKENFIVACSDETSDLTTGTSKVTFRIPYAMQITDVRASLTSAAASGVVTVDINLNGSSIFGDGETGTRLTIDSGERTSTTAATAFNFASSATVVTFGEDAEVRVDIDTVGSESPGKGLKVTLIGYQR